MGWRGGDSFYEPASMVFGMALLNVIMGGFYPLLILSLWQAFTVAGSPYPLLFAVLVWHAISNMLLSHLLFRFVAKACPLEMYHAPRWMIRQIGGSAPFLKSQLTLQALKPAAESRASEPRQRCGVGDIEAQQGKVRRASWAPYLS